MTTDERLQAALEAAQAGDPERCHQLLHPIEQEINRILTISNELLLAHMMSRQ